MKQITQAVIAAAGKGTRFLPASKEIQKEMIPVLDKPGIQYVVEEIVQAGINDITIVVDKYKYNSIKSHFSPNPSLEKRLKEAGKTEMLEQIRNLSSCANLNFVEQKGPYGNGTPLICVQWLLKADQPFVYVFADDLILHNTDKSLISLLIERYNKTPGIIMAGQEMPDAEVSRYGIANIIDKETLEFDSVVEKPKPEEAPSNLAIPGRYILEPKIIDILQKKKLGKDNELWVVDAITEYLKNNGKGYIQPINGKWFTTGDPLRHLICSIEFALQRDEFKDQIQEYIKTKC